MRREFSELADQLEGLCGGEPMDCNDAAAALGKSDADSLRYAAPTGRVLIHWEAGQKPDLWVVPAPDLDPFAARVELAKRFLHVLGPATAEAFNEWAGIRSPRGQAAFEALVDELTPVRTAVGEGWILGEDEASLRAPAPEGGLDAPAAHRRLVLPAVGP